jgi:DNA-binding CsgD family transcriptional regulator
MPWRLTLHAGGIDLESQRQPLHMRIDRKALDAIEAVYEAALDDTLWQSALQKLADATGSQAATFWLLDASGPPSLPTFSSINFDPQLIREYLDGMAEHDPTVQYLASHPDQSIVHDGLFITEREKDRHIYYDWHHRFSDTRFRLISQMSPAPGIQAGVALHRTRRKGRFEPDDVDRFAILHRHIERALALGFRFGSITSTQQYSMELLDRDPTAILLLDGSQQVVYTNQSAEILCGQGDGISLSSQDLSLAYRQDQDRLHALIARALSMRAAEEPVDDGVMQVRRPSGQRPYLLLVAPMSNRYPTLSILRPAVSIHVTDPDTRPHVSRQRLRSAFGLTDAEAQLAAALVAGDNLQTAAKRLGVQYNTARTRLAEIFLKTNTHRQSDLIHLISVSLAT